MTMNLMKMTKEGKKEGKISTRHLSEKKKHLLISPDLYFKK